AAGSDVGDRKADPCRNPTLRGHPLEPRFCDNAGTAYVGVKWGTYIFQLRAGAGESTSAAARATQPGPTPPAPQRVGLFSDFSFFRFFLCPRQKGQKLGESENIFGGRLARRPETDF